MVEAEFLSVNETTHQQRPYLNIRRQRPHTAPPPLPFDITLFGPQDFFNIALQRSEVLYDVPKNGRIIRQWTQGTSGPLERVVAEKGSALVARAIKIIAEEFALLRPVLDQINPISFADIGCGYGFFDLFVAQTYGADVHLIDLEENKNRHFGFADEGAAYSNLDKASGFLARNGINPRKVTTYNPAVSDLRAIKNVDLIISMLACGFHFPVDMYMPFFQTSLRKGGHIILDLRLKSSREQASMLATLGTVEILSETKKYQRVIVNT